MITINSLEELENFLAIKKIDNEGLKILCYDFGDDDITFNIPIEFLGEEYCVNFDILGNVIFNESAFNISKLKAKNIESKTSLDIDWIDAENIIANKIDSSRQIHCKTIRANSIQAQVLYVDNEIDCDTLHVASSLSFFGSLKAKSLLIHGAYFENIFANNKE